MDLQDKAHQNPQNECPMLDALKGKHPFEVPIDFFETQKNQIAFECKFEAKSNAGMQTPDRYFEQMQSQIAAQVHLNESSGKDIFEVPRNYFEESKAQVYTKIQEEKTRKFVFNPYRWYAAAAMLLITISVSLLWFKTEHHTSANHLVKNFSDDSVQTQTPKQDLNPSNNESVEIENYLINYYSADDLARN